MEPSCDPCIERSATRLLAILHGSRQDPAWLQVEAAMQQAAQDLNVQLKIHLQQDALVVESSSSMLAQLQATADEYAATDGAAFDALIVSIPNPAVLKQVQEMIAVQQIPVFGMNLGYQYAKEIGALGWLAQNEHKVGSLAAETLLQNSETSISKVALVTTPQNDSTRTQARYAGIVQAFEEHAHSEVAVVQDILVATETTQSSSPTTVEQINTQQVLNLASESDGCLSDSYDVLLAVDLDTAEGLLQEYAKLNDNSKCARPIRMAAMDTSPAIYRGIVNAQLEFGMDAQWHLQGSMTVLMAGLFATTGKKLALPLEEQVYLAGPKLVTRLDVPTDSMQACQADGFPVCPNENAIVPDGATRRKSACDCTERSDLRLAGVLHGVTTDPFWDVVFASAWQAARDMGVHLELDRLEPRQDGNTTLIYKQMAARITSLCDSGVDALFVTIPNAEIIAPAVQKCLDLHVPVVNINSGQGAANELGLLHHIGMNEYNAGYAAGQRMIAAGMRHGFCLHHEWGSEALIDRCRGFGDAIADHLAARSDNSRDGRDPVTTMIEYQGHFPVSNDNAAQYALDVNAMVQDALQLSVQDDWTGIGFLLGGQVQVKAARRALQDHPEALLATFDAADESVFEAMDDGLLLFGIDQQGLLQGNLPVYLLTYLAYTKQALINFEVETGPSFVTARPTRAQSTCIANMYQVCPDYPDEDMNYISDSLLALGYALCAVLLLGCAVALGWTYYYRKKWVVTVSQPTFLGLIIVGTFISSLSIPFMGFQTGYRHDQDDFSGSLLLSEENGAIREVDGACMAVPWLYGMGFVITFSALFAKIERARLVYKAGMAMRRRKIGYVDVAPIMATMFLVEMSVLLSWQFVAPLQWHREVLDEEDGSTVESVGSCNAGHKGWMFYLGQVLFHILCLVYALILCFQTKDISSDFAESSYVSLVVIFMFQVLVLAIPIVALVRDNTDVFYFIRACAIFLQNLTVLVLIFVPKMLRVHECQQTGQATAAPASMRRRSSFNMSTTSQISQRNSFTMRSNTSGFCIACQASSSQHFRTSFSGEQRGGSVSKESRNSLLFESVVEKESLAGDSGHKNDRPGSPTQRDAPESDPAVLKKEMLSSKDCSPQIKSTSTLATTLLESPMAATASLSTIQNISDGSKQGPQSTVAQPQLCNEASLLAVTPVICTSSSSEQDAEDDNVDDHEEQENDDPSLNGAQQAELRDAIVTRLVGSSSRLGQNNKSHDKTSTVNDCTSSVPASEGSAPYLGPNGATDEATLKQQYRPMQLFSEWQDLGFASQEQVEAILRLVSLDTPREARKELMLSLLAAEQEAATTS